MLICLDQGCCVCFYGRFNQTFWKRKGEGSGMVSRGSSFWRVLRSPGGPSLIQSAVRNVYQAPSMGWAPFQALGIQQ